MARYQTVTRHFSFQQPPLRDARNAHADHSRFHHPACAAISNNAKPVPSWKHEQEERAYMDQAWSPHDPLRSERH